MYLNKTFLYGNLTRDPELKALPSGTKVAEFAIATNRAYKDQNGQTKDETQYHNVIVFGRQAETSASKDVYKLVAGMIKILVKKNIVLKSLLTLYNLVQSLVVVAFQAVHLHR